MLGHAGTAPTIAACSQCLFLGCPRRSWALPKSFRRGGVPAAAYPPADAETEPEIAMWPPRLRRPITAGQARAGADKSEAISRSSVVLAGRVELTWLPRLVRFLARLGWPAWSPSAATVPARGDDPPVPPAVLARGDDPPVPPAVRPVCCWVLRGWAERWPDLDREPWSRDGRCRERLLPVSPMSSRSSAPSPARSRCDLRQGAGDARRDRQVAEQVRGRVVRLRRLGHVRAPASCR